MYVLPIPVLCRPQARLFKIFQDTGLTAAPAEKTIGRERALLRQALQYGQDGIAQRLWMFPEPAIHAFAVAEIAVRIDAETAKRDRQIQGTRIRELHQGGTAAAKRGILFLEALDTVGDVRGVGPHVHLAPGKRKGRDFAAMHVAAGLEGGRLKVDGIEEHGAKFHTASSLKTILQEFYQVAFRRKRYPLWRS